MAKKKNKPQPQIKIPAWAPLLALMGIGLALRLSVAAWQPLLFPDSTEYLSLARDIKSGEFFRANYDLDRGFNQSRRRPPLYSALVALVPVRVPLEHAAIAVSLILSMLSFIPFYLATRELSNKRAALLATLLYALSPFLVWYSSPALSEAAFTAFYVLAFYAGTMALIKPRPGWFILAGVASALLLMTKEVGVIAPAVIAAGVLIRHRAVRTRAVAWVMIMVAAFVVVAAPYLIMVRARTGHWALSAQMTSGGITSLLLAGPGDLGKADQFPLRITGPGTEREGSPGVVAAGKRIASNAIAYGFALVRALAPALFVLMLIGCIFAWRDGGRLRVPWTIGWMVPLWLAYAAVSPFMVDARYMLPLIPPALVLSADGALGLSTLLQADGKGRAAAWLLAAAAACALLARPGTFVEDLNLLRTAEPGFFRLVPVFIYFPAGVLAILAGAVFTPLRTRAARVGLVAIVAAAALALVPSFESHRQESAPGNLYFQFSSGAREAAAEIRSSGLAPPGKVMAAAKPFLPYYLDAVWFIAPDRYYSLPDTPAELDRLIEEGRLDYVALDTYSARVLKPGFGSLALGMDQRPGTRLVYSRFFDRYQRIFTVYDCRHPEPAVSPCPDAHKCLATAQTLFSRGRIVEADRELGRVLDRDPDLLDGWNLQLKIYDVYYQCLKRNDYTPTALMAPELLPSWLRAADQYRRLAPDDPAIAGLIAELRRLITRERSLMPGPD